MFLRPACLLAGLLLGGAVTATARAQGPGFPGAGAPTFSAPLLFVRLNGPPGMDAVFYQGRAKPRSFTAPITVGMRPGYLYRVRLDHIPDRPTASLFPTIEVRGSLKLLPKFGASQFPVAINFSREDIDAAFSGTLVTKVIYLEHPDRAEPRATKPGEILETEVSTKTDLFNEARNRGRIMIVVHLGERVPTAEELVRQNVPGTILFPGEKVVGPAAAPPCFPNGLARPFYDPHAGPRPLDEECVHDGGDRLNRAGYDAEGKLSGLDPEDTLVEYRDSLGRRQISCSNRVCLTVPRFAALRKECPLARSEGVINLANQRMVERDVNVVGRKLSESTTQTKKIHEYEGRLRPSVNIGTKRPDEIIGLKVLQPIHMFFGVAEAVGTKKIQQLTPIQRAELVSQVKLAIEYSQVMKLAGTEQIQGLAVVGRVENGPEIITGTVSIRDLTVCCNEAPIPPERPLCLFKCADRGAAKPGDVVTFLLRYSNVGGRAITDVAVSDSLSGRLEYIPGSAEADRDAVFTTQENEAGSVILRWEISRKLLPGQTGRLRFKARVR